MLKKLFFLLLLATPVSIFAQDKIAYISAEEVFASMPEFTQVQTKLKAKSETIQKNAAAIEDEYAALIDKFQKSSEEVTASVAADRQKQLEQLQERYQNFVQSSQTEFEQEQQKQLSPLRDKMQKAIKEVGDENGYSYIADAAAFMYISPSAVNATKLVKTKLGISQ